MEEGLKLSPWTDEPVSHVSVEIVALWKLLVENRRWCGKDPLVMDRTKKKKMIYIFNFSFQSKLIKPLPTEKSNQMRHCFLGENA